MSSAPSHCLVFLNLQDATRVDRLNVTPLSLAVLLVLLVDVQQEVLDLVAGSHVLRVEAGTDAEMERLLGLLLFWSFFEP